VILVWHLFSVAFHNVILVRRLSSVAFHNVIECLPFWKTCHDEDEQEQILAFEMTNLKKKLNNLQLKLFCALSNNVFSGSVLQ
jgi:hypothetical protein